MSGGRLTVVAVLFKVITAHVLLTITIKRVFAHISVSEAGKNEREEGR
jgi:hypothetical protein